MTADEIWSLNQYFNMRIQIFVRTYRAYQSGILQKSDWEASIRNAPVFLGTPFGQMMWKNLKIDIQNQPEFISAIDNVLATSTRMSDASWLATLESQAKSLSPP